MRLYVTFFLLNWIFIVIIDTFALSTEEQQNAV